MRYRCNQAAAASSRRQCEQTLHTGKRLFERPAENITILSFAYDSTATHRRWPVEWVVKWQRPYINSSMGHLWKGETYPDVLYRMSNHNDQSCKVSYKMPENFPTKDSIHLKSEIDPAK